jgi:hypothetical protein
MRSGGSEKGIGCRIYSKTASLGHILKDLQFPTKDKIIQFVHKPKKNPNTDLLSLLQFIENRQYQNVFDVTKSAGLVY